MPAPPGNRSRSNLKKLVAQYKKRFDYSLTGAQRSIYHLRNIRFINPFRVAGFDSRNSHKIINLKKILQ